MATYTLESDKIFIRCSDVGVVEVYEIESLDIAFLEKKNWKDLPAIDLGRGKEYDVLKIGDTKITGRGLKRVMEDLIDSQLMVNREGLCILSTAEIKHEFEVEYYRIFDIFDWSKYEVKMGVTTKWSRSDVLSGQSMPDPEGESERKLEELVKEYEKELAITKERVEKLEKELKLRVFEHSDLHPPQFISSVITQVRTPFTMSVRSGLVSKIWASDFHPSSAMVMDKHVSEKEMASLVRKSIELRVLSEGDKDNWWAVKICGSRLKSDNEYESGIFVYYDGTMGYFKIDHVTEEMPIPVTASTPKGINTNEAFIYLQGLGPRFGCFFLDED